MIAIRAVVNLGIWVPAVCRIASSITFVVLAIKARWITVVGRCADTIHVCLKEIEFRARASRGAAITVVVALLRVRLALIVFCGHLHSVEICYASAVETAEIDVPLDSAVDEVSLPVVRLTMGNRILAICNESFATSVAEEFVIMALACVSCHILCGLDTIDRHFKRRDNDVARWLM